MRRQPPCAIAAVRAAGVKAALASGAAARVVTSGGAVALRSVTTGGAVALVELVASRSVLGTSGGEDGGQGDDEWCAHRGQ